MSHERLDRPLEVWTRGRVPVRTTADRCNARLAASYDMVMCTTAWTAEEFVRLGVPNLRRVPLGVDLARFTPDRRSPALRRALAAPGEALLVHAGRLSPEKRPGLAVDALVELLRRGTPARLVVAGDGVVGPAVRRRARGLPVRFLGFVHSRERLATLLATADAVLAPGPVETFGLAALEALASGTPVVVNAANTLPELLTPGAGAAVAGSGCGVADGVGAVLAVDPTTRQAAARAAAERFPWSAAVEGFLAAHRLPRATVEGRG